MSKGNRKLDLLKKLATLYSPAATATFFPKHIREWREELGLSLERVESGEDCPDDLKKEIEESSITVVCRHLYSHEEEIVEEHAGRVMQAVSSKYESLSDEEAIQVVDRVVNELMLVRGLSPEALPKIEKETLRRLRGLWDSALRFCWILYPKDKKKYLVEALLYAEGKHEDQVDITDDDIQLTEEELAQLESDGDYDVEQVRVLDDLREKFMTEHREKLEADALATCEDERRDTMKMTIPQLKAYIGRNFGVQETIEEHQKERTIWRLYYTIRDPETKVREKVGHGSADGHGKFFDHVSLHPLLREDEEEGESESDYSDVRTVATSDEMREFWQFLVELDDKTRICKTQEDVERLADSRPFRHDMASAIGDAVVSLGLTDAIQPTGGHRESVRRTEETRSASEDAGGGGEVDSTADASNEEVSEGLESLDSLL